AREARGHQPRAAARRRALGCRFRHLTRNGRSSTKGMSPRPPILGRTRTPGRVSRESGEGPGSGSAEGSGGRRGVGLSGALLAYAVAMTLTITLAPFRFEAPGRVNLLVVGG